jgi:uncharacterized membrane protein (Fun14 family)
MAKQPTKPKRKFHLGWRGPLIFVLSTLGITSLVGFMLVHWTERQILTTDNWVKIVAPLPKNDAVATSLSTYSVDKLFSGIDVEQKISDALPDKASFLADPLTDRLQARTQNLTKNIIQSDRFQNIWITANRAAHQRLMDSARGTSKPAPKINTNFNLDLSPLRQAIKDRLGVSFQPIFASQPRASDNKESLKASLSTKLSTFKKFVRSVDFLNGVLGLLGLACLVGAIVLTTARRKLLLIISSAILVISLLQLIGVKAVRPAILNHIQNQSYRPAAGVVYDSLISNFKRSATLVVILSLAVVLIAILTRKQLLSRSRFVKHQLKIFSTSGFYKFVARARIEIRRYRRWIAAAIILFSLILAAFALDLDWQGILRLAFLTILAIEVVSLVAASSTPETPMK